MSPVLPSAFFDDLSWRGLIYDSTDPKELIDHLAAGNRRFYIGFDPTAPSLTIGNLLPLILMVRAARAGLGAVVVLGGGTGLIGDPSGRSAERTLLTADQARRNVQRHRSILESIFERVLDKDSMPEFVDNADWLVGLGVIEFLRDVGKHFSIADMTRKDSVRRRLEDPASGITFTEFSYSLLQAYDFLRLYRDKEVTVQMGASDQWGNIVAGIDLIRRTCRGEAYGLTCPLLLRSDGTKFGKTESGAVWLSAERTSAYSLYQFIVNLADEEAERFARYFSLVDRRYLEGLFSKSRSAPEQRVLQRHLAREITAMVHGEQAAARAEETSEALFKGELSSIGSQALGEVLDGVPTVELPISLLEAGGMDLVDLLVATKLATSKRAAREHLDNGAIMVNGTRARQGRMVGVADLLDGSIVLLRRGKRQWCAARFTQPC